MPVLSAEDHSFFEENGYVVIHQAVPQENLDALIREIFEFLEMDPTDPEDWYRDPLRPNGMVEMYQSQGLWNNRQYPKVHAAFSEIWGNERLWVSFDRACLKPPSNPNHPEYENKGFTHWDVDTSKPPFGFGVQGVLYLADTDENQGGFQCVPGMHRGLEEWIKTQPADRNPRVPDLSGRTVVPIPGKAGDLLIWNSLLPHGNGHNRSNRPRLAQYISMRPARDQDEEYRQYRIDCWKRRLPPKGDPFPGDPRHFEQTRRETAALTSLGRKLLGLDLWDAA